MRGCEQSGTHMQLFQRFGRSFRTGMAEQASTSRRMRGGGEWSGLLTCVDRIVPTSGPPRQSSSQWALVTPL